MGKNEEGAPSFPMSDWSEFSLRKYAVYFGKHFDHYTSGKMELKMTCDTVSSLNSQVRFLRKEKGIIASPAASPSPERGSVESLSPSASGERMPSALVVEKLKKVGSSKGPMSFFGNTTSKMEKKISDEDALLVISDIMQLAPHVTISPPADIVARHLAAQAADRAREVGGRGAVGAGSDLRYDATLDLSSFTSLSRVTLVNMRVLAVRGVETVQELRLVHAALVVPLQMQILTADNAATGEDLDLVELPTVDASPPVAGGGTQSRGSKNTIGDALKTVMLEGLDGLHEAQGPHLTEVNMLDADLSPDAPMPGALVHTTCTKTWKAFSALHSLRCHECHARSGHQLSPEGIARIAHSLRVIDLVDAISGQGFVFLRLPDVKNSWMQVSEIDFSRNGLEKLDSSWELLRNLVTLNLSHNRLTVLHPCLRTLESLQTVNLAGNLFTSANVISEDLPRIEHLDVSQNKLTSAVGLGNLTELLSLSLNANMLHTWSDLTVLAERSTKLMAISFIGNPMCHEVYQGDIVKLGYCIFSSRKGIRINGHKPTTWTPEQQLALAKKYEKVFRSTSTLEEPTDPGSARFDASGESPELATTIGAPSMVAGGAHPDTVAVLTEQLHLPTNVAHRLLDRHSLVGTRGAYGGGSTIGGYEYSAGAPSVSPSGAAPSVSIMNQTRISSGGGTNSDDVGPNESASMRGTASPSPSRKRNDREGEDRSGRRRHHRRHHRHRRRDSRSGSESEEEKIPTPEPEYTDPLEGLNANLGSYSLEQWASLEQTFGADWVAAQRKSLVKKKIEEQAAEADREEQERMLSDAAATSAAPGAQDTAQSLVVKPFVMQALSAKAQAAKMRREKKTTLDPLEDDDLEAYVKPALLTFCHDLQITDSRMWRATFSAKDRHPLDQGRTGGSGAGRVAQGSGGLRLVYPTGAFLKFYPMQAAEESRQSVLDAYGEVDEAQFPLHQYQHQNVWEIPLGGNGQERKKIPEVWLLDSDAKQAVHPNRYNGKYLVRVDRFETEGKMGFSIRKKFMQTIESGQGFSKRPIFSSYHICPTSRGNHFHSPTFNNVGLADEQSVSAVKLGRGEHMELLSTVSYGSKELTLCGFVFPSAQAASCFVDRLRQKLDDFRNPHYVPSSLDWPMFTAEEQVVREPYLQRDEPIVTTVGYGTCGSGTTVLQDLNTSNADVSPAEASARLEAELMEEVVNALKLSTREMIQRVDVSDESSQLVRQRLGSEFKAHAEDLTMYTSSFLIPMQGGLSRDVTQHFDQCDFDLPDEQTGASLANAVAEAAVKADGSGRSVEVVGCTFLSMLNFNDMGLGIDEGAEVSVFVIVLTTHVCFLLDENWLGSSKPVEEAFANPRTWPCEDIRSISLGFGFQTMLLDFGVGTRPVNLITREPTLTLRFLGHLFKVVPDTTKLELHGWPSSCALKAVLNGVNPDAYYHHMVQKKKTAAANANTSSTSIQQDEPKTSAPPPTEEEVGKYAGTVSGISQISSVKSEPPVHDPHDDGVKVPSWGSGDGAPAPYVVMDHKARLIRFYNKYNPEKVASVDRTLTAFAGREDDMWSSLETKYGPEDPLPVPPVQVPIDDGDGSEYFEEEEDDDDDQWMEGQMAELDELPEVQLSGVVGGFYARFVGDFSAEAAKAYAEQRANSGNMLMNTLTKLTTGVFGGNTANSLSGPPRGHRRSSSGGSSANGDMWARGRRRDIHEWNSYNEDTGHRIYPIRHLRNERIVWEPITMLFIVDANNLIILQENYDQWPANISGDYASVHTRIAFKNITGIEVTSPMSPFPLLVELKVELKWDEQPEKHLIVFQHPNAMNTFLRLLNDGVERASGTLIRSQLVVPRFVDLVPVGSPAEVKFRIAQWTKDSGSSSSKNQRLMNSRQGVTYVHQQVGIKSEKYLFDYAASFLKSKKPIAIDVPMTSQYHLQDQ